MEIFIIIPTLRERENLELLIPHIFSLMPDVNMVIVDDNSQDGTRELITEISKKYPKTHLLERVTDHGYGKSILDGLRLAFDHGAQHVVTMDADFSHDPQILPPMLKLLATHDIVFGSRYVPGGSIADWSWYRKLLSRFANFYARTILEIPFRDITTGFVAYHRKAVETLLTDQPSSEGYSFLIETKYILFRRHFSFLEHPLVFKDRTGGTSKMSSKVIWESIWLPWRLRFGRPR